MASEFIDLGSILSSTSSETSLKRNINRNRNSSSSPIRTSTPKSTKNQNNALIPTKRRNVLVIPTLYKLCISAISSKIERYPAEVFSALSETEWERIIRHRHQSTAPTNTTRPPNFKNGIQQRWGIDGFGRMSPAISDKTMREIEDCNPHLACSKVADQMIWKDCVEYKFKRDGPTRPRALWYPYAILMDRLNQSVKNLSCLLESPPRLPSCTNKNNSISNHDQDLESKKESICIDAAHKAIYESLKILMESPMSVDLLNETKIGKSISKFIKKVNKLTADTQNTHNTIHISIWKHPISLQRDEDTRFKSVGNNSHAILPEQHLQKIVQSWKEVASSQGVKIAQTSNSPTLPTRNTGITDPQQYAQDMRVLQMCHSWRDLFEALTERKEHMLESHGAKMREKRQSMEKSKHSVKQVKLRANKFQSRNAIRAVGNASSGSTTKSTSKLSAWKKETTLNKARQMGKKITNFAPNVSSFSMAVANATKKRKTTVARKKEVVLEGGNKRMRMPTRDRDNNFRSNQLKNRLKHKAFGRY